MAVISLMRGRSVAMVLWHTMHVRTLGSPATGPVVTDSWQYSVQPIFLRTCTLWGNSIGCSGFFSCRPVKSFSASAKLDLAVVKTAVLWPGRSGAFDAAG